MAKSVNNNNNRFVNLYLLNIFAKNDEELISKRRRDFISTISTSEKNNG